MLLNKDVSFPVVMVIKLCQQKSQLPTVEAVLPDRALIKHSCGGVLEEWQVLWNNAPPQKSRVFMLIWEFGRLPIGRLKSRTLMLIQLSVRLHN